MPSPFVAFIPLLVIIGIGLLIIIPIIKNDRKLSPSYKIHHNYASFWLRLLAFIIDFVIISVLFGIIRTILSIKLNKEFIVADYGFFVLYRGPIVVIIWWLYCALFESSKAMATIGKMAVKIKVTNLLGNRITFWNATGRFFGKLISSFFLCMGFLMIFFMSTKQGLHDVWAQTAIIMKQSPNSINPQIDNTNQ
ncbi:MAG: RDD family protein [Bacteroidales bacterium]|jgi:uncharacterized RDD family membrane protein YckC